MSPEILYSWVHDSLQKIDTRHVSFELIPLEINMGMLPALLQQDSESFQRCIKDL